MTNPLCSAYFVPRMVVRDLSLRADPPTQLLYSACEGLVRGALAGKLDEADQAFPLTRRSADGVGSARDVV